MLWAAWHFGREAPHRLYHFPDEPVPVGTPREGEDNRPRFKPARVKAFIYACAAFSLEIEAQKMKASMGGIGAMAGALGGGRR